MTGLPIKQLLAVITPVVVLVGRLLLCLLLLMLLIRRVDRFAGSLALKVTLTPGDQVAHAGSPSPYDYRRGPVPDAAAPDQVFVTAELSGFHHDGGVVRRRRARRRRRLGRRLRLSRFRVFGLQTELVQNIFEALLCVACYVLVHHNQKALLCALCSVLRFITLHCAAF